MLDRIIVSITILGWLAALIAGVGGLLSLL